MKTRYTLVIDTEQYAGNFERDMCAFCTGIVGDCERGEEYAKIFYRKYGDNSPFGDRYNNVLEQRPDYHGCLRPCAMYETPGWFNNGLGGHFRYDDPEAENKALAAWIKSSIAYSESTIKNYLRTKTDLEAGKKVHTWTIENINEAINREERAIEKAKNTTSVSHYTSYQSVAIFFYDRPTKRQINIIKKRAMRFNKVRKRVLEKKGLSWSGDITITGFRLIREVTYSYESPI